MRYRAEIDGLRALAVIPVIFFHTGSNIFSGGFIGVDIFFVISGYLITTILLEEIENGDFSFLKFYERRVRRLFPALFAMVLICIPIAYILMFPGELKDFAQSIVAIIFFISNILFFFEAGYFTLAAGEKPFLHTWSLAVEEQYYLVFPIFLFLTWKYGAKKVFWIIIALVCLSLALSEWSWRNILAANFYLAPTRAWELLAGSIAYFCTRKNGVKSSNILSLFGLCILLFCIFNYDESIPTPSVYLLLPVFGTVLIIIFADKGTIAAKILGTKFLIFIGLISYSSYLWHQPLLAFARIYTLDQVTTNIALGLICLTFLLACLSFRFVEIPFRNAKIIGQKCLWIIVFSVSSFLLIIGLSGHFFYSKLITKDALMLELETARRDWRHIEELQKTKFDDYFKMNAKKPADILFFGDSHAQQYNILSQDFEKKGFNVGFLSQGGCLPIPGLHNDVVGRCFNFVEQLENVLAEEKDLRAIVFAGCFNCAFINSSNFKPGFLERQDYVKDHNKKLYLFSETGRLKALKLFSDKIKNLSKNYEIIVIGDNPKMDEFSPEILMQFYYRNKNFFFQKYPKFQDKKFIVNKNLILINEKIKKSIENYAKFINVIEIVCAQGICNTFGEGGRLKYKDNDHMRPWYVQKTFSDLSFFETILKKNNY